MPYRQQSLFADEPTPWEVDDQRDRLVAAVVLPVGPEGEFDYLVPDPLASLLEVGCRVSAPFGRGNRRVIGYCVRLDVRGVDAQGPRLKSIEQMIDRRSLLSASMLRVTRRIADYYLASWGQVLEAVVPAAVRGQAGTRRVTLLSVPPAVAARIEELQLPAKQAHVLQTLACAPRPLTAAQLARLAGCTPGPITSLKKKGLVEARQERIVTELPSEPPVPRAAGHQLNADQQRALDTVNAALRDAAHETILIHGVTGSGKTEVYIRAIETVVGFGRQAIVLVPEISLTPQTVRRFRARFDRVAVLHSHQTSSQRHWHWQEIAAGAVQVVVGPRSAVFAPTPQLGLIILDEEHETSFKQETAPRYHAREVARWRTEMEQVPLVLGSATPSLESWQRATTAGNRLVGMPRRVLDRPLPDVRTVDLRSEVRTRGSRGAISRPLHQAMATALGDGGQVILLLNRRGFATHIQCQSCGHVVGCPQCDIALTHHRTEDIVVCHYCDYRTTAPEACPECEMAGIRYGGMGTQRLEAEVRARFPQAPCLRMDTDSMRRRGSHARALDAFRRGDVRILLGTQMIAKGLDFPEVTLVGVINADTALHLPDFRAGERTFQLVTQVAGRTGRGPKGGRVLVQTFDPDHPAIQAAVRHDYGRFVAAEIPVRREHGYPPFGCMVRIVIRGPGAKTTGDFAQHVADRLRDASREHQAHTRLLGPAPAPIGKLRGRFRYQIQLQAPASGPLRAAVRHALVDLKARDQVQWIVDIDPIDML
jgi:primosomal protein N' (replication factor Y)